MIFPVSNEYRIKSETYSWTIQKKKVRTDKSTGLPVDYYEPVFHYMTLEAAINGLGQMMVRFSNAEGVVDASEEIKSIATTLSLAFTPEYKRVI